MSEKLALCPLCGKKPELMADMPRWYYTCIPHWDGPLCDTPEQAAEAWNGPAGLWALGPEIVRVIRANILLIEDEVRLLAKLEALGIKEKP